MLASHPAINDQHFTNTPVLIDDGRDIADTD
jgi:hypothetical protein